MNRIKELRNQKNLTVLEVSKDLNIPQSTLTNYENGKREPRDHKTWEKIALYFNVDIAYLMGLSDIPRLDNISKNNIQEYRISRDMTIEELSEKTGVNVKILEKYENEQLVPDKPSIWMSIANALSTPVSSIMGLDEIGESKNNESELELLKRKNQLIQNIVTLELESFTDFTTNVDIFAKILPKYSKLDNSNQMLLDEITTTFLTWLKTDIAISYFREKTATMTTPEKEKYLKDNFGTTKWEEIHHNQKQIIARLIPLLNGPDLT